jgi:hypothetical protein
VKFEFQTKTQNAVPNFGVGPCMSVSLKDILFSEFVTVKFDSKPPIYTAVTPPIFSVLLKTGRYCCLIL